MARNSLLALLLLALAACGGKPELPEPKGAWVHLNGDKYPADPNDITNAPPDSGMVRAQR